MSDQTLRNPSLFRNHAHCCHLWPTLGEQIQSGINQRLPTEVGRLTLMCFSYLRHA
jgi:hypothetical protein